jgi:hypothetical protein
MSNDQIQELAAKVIRRLARRLGATGKEGSLIVVFSAATVAFGEALGQVRKLILDGFRIQLAFSQAAEHLVSSAVKDGLLGFPHVDTVESTLWLKALQDARAVVVPLLSLNTLSKLALLTPDNAATNIILHALLMAKPVVLARNGADPNDRGREALGFHQGNPALSRAMAARLQTIEDYGCILTDVRDMEDTIKSLLLGKGTPQARQGKTVSVASFSIHSVSGRFVTAADIMHAQRSGRELSMGSATGVTPLARELARQYGVVLSSDSD